jgi:cell wall-associated NlpC family hydrolase
LSDRVPARHRSRQRPVTFLTDVGEAVSGRLSDVGRSGAVLAASTGILAVGAMPTHAYAADQAATAAAPASPLGLASQAGPFRTLSSAGRDGGGALTAPMLATVSFESSAFTADPTVARPAIAAAAVHHVAATKKPAGQIHAPAKPAKSAPVPAKRSPVPAKQTVPAKRAPVPAKHTVPAKQTVPAKRAPAPAKHTVPAKRTVPAAKSPKRAAHRPASRPAPHGVARGSSVLAVAARYVGTPYLYGGTTPHGFDCSGYTGYVYRQLGISLPRTANQQFHATRHISRSQARAGDLVFFVSGGRAYHVGIYAGGGKIYDAPHTGRTIQKRAIWDATVVFGRVTH